MTVTHPAVGWGLGSLLKRSRWTPWIAACGGLLPDLSNVVRFAVFYGEEWAMLSFGAWRTPLLRACNTYAWYSHALLLSILCGIGIIVVRRLRRSLLLSLWLGWIAHIPVDMISHIPADMPRYFWPLPVPRFGGLFHHEMANPLMTIAVEGIALVALCALVWCVRQVYDLCHTIHQENHPVPQ